ncbi:HAD hydrolase family protein [Methylocystis iwaonis]|uniref:HAD hydrolase family protein n=1 Tax=Methylocystis iwaonis TaxID=2885079 RepID=UPI002E7ABB6F|nr:HAD hydrolase family protein [Methylocystis iwaonis]
MTLRPEARTAARLKRIKLVLMDVDGTLVTSDSATFSRVVDQLRRLKGIGVNFSIATGRTINGVAPIIQQMEDVGAKLPPMITYNGAVVALGEKPLVLKIKTIERGAFSELVKRCRVAGVSPLAYACTATPFGVLQETTYSEGADGATTEFNGSLVRRVDDLLRIEDDIVAVLIRRPAGPAGDALLADLTDRFGRVLRITTSGGPYIEICHPLGNKRNAMVELAQMLRIEAEDVMAIGDNFNDLEMIEGAGVGVAVANSPELVKAAATLVCSQGGANGVVEALRVLMRVIRTEKALSGALARAI